MLGLLGTEERPASGCCELVLFDEVFVLISLFMVSYLGEI